MTVCSNSDYSQAMAKHGLVVLEEGKRMPGVGENGVELTQVIQTETDAFDETRIDQLEQRICSSELNQSAQKEKYDDEKECVKEVPDNEVKQDLDGVIGINDTVIKGAKYF